MLLVVDKHFPFFKRNTPHGSVGEEASGVPATETCCAGARAWKARGRAHIHARKEARTPEASKLCGLSVFRKPEWPAWPRSNSPNACSRWR